MGLRSKVLLMNKLFNNLKDICTAAFITELSKINSTYKHPRFPNQVNRYRSIVCVCIHMPGHAQ